MLRWYVRLASWLLLATLCTTLISRGLLYVPDKQIALDLVGGHAAALAKRLATAHPAERRDVTSALADILGYPVGVEPAMTGPSPQAQWRATGLFVTAAVAGSAGQVRLGPLPPGQVSTLPEALLLALCVSLGIAWLCTRPIGRRTQRLEQVAARMCQGDFSVRAPANDGDALDAVAHSLNQLADRIGQLLSDERDLLRTVAHEVRAPIARMRFRVDRIQSREQEFETSESAGLVSDLQQVDALFEELLTYVAFDEFDYERPDLQTTKLALTEAVQVVVDEVTATSEELTVRIEGNTKATILANRRLFERAVTNLLLNAMAYGEGKITVFVREHEQRCVVDVQDNGPGIAEQDRRNVVKPFVRLGKKKTRGTGLGLAIVARIMALHGGRLHIVQAPGGGASMQLVWPNARPRPLPRWRLFLGPFSRDTAQLGKGSEPKHAP